MRMADQRLTRPGLLDARPSPGRRSAAAMPPMRVTPDAAPTVPAGLAAYPGGFVAYPGGFWGRPAGIAAEISDIQARAESVV